MTTRIDAPRDSNLLLRDHIELIRSLARGLIRSLPAGIEYDDLLQAGCVAFLEAAGKYEINPAAFRLYARLRVRGAMLDYVRRFYPDTFELDESLPDPISIEACIEARQIRDRVRAAVASLPCPERRVIDMKYNANGDQIPQREIGLAMGVSQVRVSQRHRSGLRLLRSALAAERAA